MYKRISQLVFLFFCAIGCLFTHPAMAQGNGSNEPVQMADKFRADGKIYVVIIVVMIILLGLIGYVVRLDRKISRFEKELK